MRLKSSRRKTSGIGITIAAAAATALLTGARLAPNAAGAQAQETAKVTAVTPVSAAFLRQPAAAGGQYTVRSGDTLATIAGKEYGSMYCWPGIYQTNKDRLSNPNLIYPGQGLRIPGKCDTQSPPVVTTVTATVAYQPRHALAAATAAQNYSGGGGTSFQECVIRTESGGNPDVWNASGHWGLYQFSESTWVEYGGPASEFGSASVAEQNQVFDNAMATPGGAENWSPYDGC